MEFDRSRRRYSQEEGPKVEVKTQSSLFLISYTDAPCVCDEWDVSVFIDIPTIDFYKDELTNTKLSRFNRQFKLHHLKESIYKSLTRGDEEFWERWLSEGGKKFIMSISSSGSLRYVETIKFLVESVYTKLRSHVREVKVEFRLDVSPTTYKWFTSFLDPRVLEDEVVCFTQVHESGPLSPFKDYYNLLSKKFEESQSGVKSSESIDSISIITNSTGVKALLTILSDRPLTNFITRESLEMLHDSALKKAHSPSHEEDTPLKRESSSLLNFQDQLLTSNKDKSVKVRSLSINRRSNMAMPLPMSPRRVGSAVSIDQEEADYEDELDGAGNEDVELEDEEISNDNKDEDEDEDEDEDDDGISFTVPTKLSHTQSSELLSTTWRPIRNGRTRSLSLMDPALRKPFETTQGGLPLSMAATEDEASSSENMRITNIYVHDGDFQDSTDLGKRHRRKTSRLVSRQSSANGLIPPEFYSRISSPSTSASSSNTSLQNVNMAPGTFSKMATAGGNTQETGNMDSLFEKNLINKSFEETRKNNLLGSIIEKLQSQNQNPDKNGLALNFVSNKTIPSHMLDEEDLIMSGGGGVNISRSFSPEYTSEDDNRSNSTMVLPSNRDDDNDMESTNTVATPTVALDLSKVKLYDDEPQRRQQDQTSPSPPPSSSVSSLSVQPQENPDAQASSSLSGNRPPPRYKKAFTLDLYGDDDLENSGGWVLGGNAR